MYCENQHILISIARKLRTLGDIVEHAAFRNLRRSGGRVEIYKSLNRLWLLNKRFETVIDIGANVGQFASSVQCLIPNAQIYSFEPIPSCYLQLQQKFADSANVKCFNYGLGADTAEMLLFENKFSPSSSFLRTTSRQTDAFPHTQAATPILVSVKRLDDVAANLDITTPLLVKIDVQGYELPVLIGGQATIQKSDVVIIETSFVELYEGQALFSDIYEMLTQWGFRYAGAIDQFVDLHTGEILQSDSIFLANK